MTEFRPVRTCLADAVHHLKRGDAAAAQEALDEALDRPAVPGLPALLAPVAVPQPLGVTRAIDAVAERLDLEDVPTLRLQLGRLHLLAGCPAAALDAFDQAARFRKVAVAAKVGKGQALLALGLPAEAQGRFDDLLARNPEHPDALAGRAAALAALGRLREATVAWKTLLALEPRDPVATLRVQASEPIEVRPEPSTDEARAWRWALALCRDDRTPEALTILEELAARPGASPDTFAALARVRLVAGARKPAAEAAERAVRAPSVPRTRLAIADVLRALGHQDARNVYDDARLAGIHDPELLAGCADGLGRLGAHADALAVADEALAHDPALPLGLAARIRALGALGRGEEAAPTREALRAVDPEHPDAVAPVHTGERREPTKTERGVARIHHDLGRSMLTRGRFREALVAFRKATEMRPDWAEPWRQMGLAHLQLEERDEAIAAFRASLEREPDDAEAAARLGDLLREQGELDAAALAYERALQIEPTSAAARIGRAEVHRLEGRFTEAVTDHETALRALPDDPVALAGLAASLNGLRRYAEARNAWMRAREQDPHSAFVGKGLAQCHAGLRGTTPLAFEDVSREAQPRRSEAWAEHDPVYDRYEAMDHVDRGRSYQKERNYAAAIECFRRAIDIDPTCDEAALRLGMAYEDDRQFRRAITAYRTCLEIEPNHYQAATNIGEAYRKNEQYREAIAAYDQALAMKPDYLYALAGRAECMRMLGRYQECLAWFDKALAVGPNHAFAIQGKAASLNALGSFEEALPFWVHALEIEPQSQFALDGRANCENQIKRGEGTPAPVEGEEEDEDAESTTPTLDEQGRDLTALARAGRLPEVVGRDSEIRQVMKTLVRRLKANPLLLGEPGVGKTAVVEGLAQRLTRSDAPERLRDLRIIELSMGSLIAGTKYRGTFEERLREIVKEASSVPGLVLFIDEIHTLVGAGRTEGGSLDAANILKPALARGEITVIGATTHAEFRRHFESDSALERRFQPITVEEPTAEDCVALLLRIAPTYEAHHRVKVRKDAIEACVTMAVRYIPDRRLPDKALDMLDEACAEASLSEHPVVDAETVAHVVSERTGVPVQRLTEADRARMDRMEVFLKERVVGQDDAVRKLADAVRLSKAGLRSTDRPRGVFLFRGASGVGKTELAKALADFLFPEGDALVRLDMSEYADRSTASRLLGAPPGYVGHGEEGQLTGPLRRKPYSVVLLDEFEKAHPDVQAVFLSLLDEGIVTDADGRQINAREAFFILTTNAGADVRSSGKMGFGPQASEAEAALDAVRPFFRPELLDRIDEVVPFSDLGPDALRRIASDRLDRLAERAAGHGITLTWEEDVVDAVRAVRLVGERGARQTLRAVDTQVGEPLGRLLLRLGDGAARTLHVHVVDGDIRFDEVQPERQPAPTA